MSSIWLLLKRSILIPISFVIIFIGCAEIGHPPGGEVDKVKPRILASIPANGSTNVAPDNTIEISFSERLFKPTSDKSVFISPRPSSDPEIKWKSDKVIIKLSDSFAVDQTYIISFADGINDLRRNPLDSGSVVAFTTGEKLASGSINGIIYDENNNPRNNIVTGLYHIDIFNQELVIDSLYPSYLVISNDEGYFSFQYIPNGEYLLVAFLDKNKNDKLDQRTDLYGLPVTSIFLDSLNQQVNNLQLALTSHESDELTISSVRQTNDNLFKIDFDFKASSKQLSFQSYADSTLAYDNLFELQTDSTAINSLITYFGEIPEGNYKLLFQHNDTLLTFDSVAIKNLEDITNPQIKASQSDKIKLFRDSLNIQIQFSEPLDTSYITDETFYFIDVDSNLFFPEIEFQNKSLCTISNSFLQKDIHIYQLSISEFDILDLAGNKLGDSTTKIEINLINPDSLGTVNGVVVNEYQTDNEVHAILSFKNTRTMQIYTFNSTQNLFNLQLQQGNYILSGFIDINNNMTRDFGSLYPLQYAEPYMTYSDTIKVRARFETTDLQMEFKKP